MQIYGEIEYRSPQGNIHNDLCAEISDPKFRAFLHESLDEWLDESGGTGTFYVGDPVYSWDAEDFLWEWSRRREVK